MEFSIGQIFSGDYPPEAADWCNSNGAYIDEISPESGVRRFAIFASPAPTAEELAAQKLAQAKAVRAEAVDKIIVEVDGLKFDANEQAQSRMARSLAGAMALGLDLDATTTQWVLADNSIATVSARQLAQALQLAGAAQTELWVVPYEDN